MGNKIGRKSDPLFKSVITNLPSAVEVGTEANASSSGPTTPVYGQSSAGHTPRYTTARTDFPIAPGALPENGNRSDAGGGVGQGEAGAIGMPPPLPNPAMPGPPRSTGEAPPLPPPPSRPAIPVPEPSQRPRPSDELVIDIGATIYGVNLVRQVGKGKYGVVYLGRDGRGEDVAVKTIDMNRLKTRTEKTLIADEVKIHARLDHPNIVEFIASKQTADRRWVIIFMEFAPSDLNSWYLNLDAPLPESVLLDYFRQLADAVYYLRHDQYIAHRDIKPANIVVVPAANGDQHPGGIPRCTVKLTDFGFATERSPDEGIDELQHCTPYYAPPNVLLNEPDAGDHDTWSIAVVIFEVAMCHRPFSCKTRDDLVRKVIAADYVFDNPRVAPRTMAEAPPLSLDFETVIRAMLMPGVTDRLTILGLRAHRLLSPERQERAVAAEQSGAPAVLELEMEDEDLDQLDVFYHTMVFHVECDFLGTMKRPLDACYQLSQEALPEDSQARQTASKLLEHCRFGARLLDEAIGEFQRALAATGDTETRIFLVDCVNWMAGARQGIEVLAGDVAAAVDVFEQAGDMTQTYIDLKAVNEDYTQCFARFTEVMGNASEFFAAGWDDARRSGLGRADKEEALLLWREYEEITLDIADLESTMFSTVGALRENAALVKEAIASCERAEEAIVQEWANAELLLRASNKIISLDALVSAAATAAPAALPPTTGADDESAAMATMASELAAAREAASAWQARAHQKEGELSVLETNHSTVVREVEIARAEVATLEEQLAKATADKERYRGKRDMMAARNADLQQVLLDWSTGAVEDRAALDRLQAICEGA